MKNNAMDKYIVDVARNGDVMASFSAEEWRSISQLHEENKRLTKLTDTQAIRIEGYKEECEQLREHIKKIEYEIEVSERFFETMKDTIL